MALVSVTFRLLIRKDGLLRLPNLLNKNMSGGLWVVGKRLVSSAKSRMRKDSGAEHKSLNVLVQGSKLGLRLTVYSEIVQAFVDAYGLRRGVFPNFRINSKLYKWSMRRVTKVTFKKMKGTKGKVKTLGASKRVVVPEGPIPHLGVKGQIPSYQLRKITSVLGVKHGVKVSGPGVIVKASARFKAKQNDAKRLAFLVARAIYNRGVKPTAWNKKTLEANKQMIIREMQNAIARTANELGR